MKGIYGAVIMGDDSHAQGWIRPDSINKGKKSDLAYPVAVTI